MQTMSPSMWSILLLVLAATVASAAPAANVRQRVLLVSLDGFRWDYLNRQLTPNFNKFRTEGASADHVVSTFTTKTFPCHTSIVTGRYQEHHGMVGNSMFDPTTNKTFSMGNKDPFWWEYNNSLPIWISAVKANLRAGVYFWPGSEVPRQNLSATAWFNYDGSVPLRTKFDQVVNWFKSGYELALLYHNQPDSVGHDAGPDDDETDDMLTELDTEFEFFFQLLMNNNLYDNVNIIITADHGMTTILNSIKLRDYNITDKDIRIVESGPILQAYFANGANEQFVWNKLEQVQLWTLYRKNNIPDRLHFRDNPRISPILAIPNEGYQITKSGDTNLMGNHGFDNEISRMWPIFMARGPAFKKGFKYPGGIEQVDIYPLICELLQIPCEKHDGDLRRVQDLLTFVPESLASTSTRGGSSTISAPTAAILAFTTLTLATTFFQF